MLFTLPEDANYTIQECYQVIRGATKDNHLTSTFYPNDMILHARFEVPKDANFKLSDIKVNEKPLKWGSQIAETFNVQLAGTAFKADVNEQATKFPAVSNREHPLPSVGYVLDHNILQASLNATNQLLANTNLTPCITKIEASSTTQIAIVAFNATERTQFDFGEGIKVKVLKEKIEKFGNSALQFQILITTDADIELGQKSLVLYNNDNQARFATAGALEVAAAGSLPLSTT